MREIRLYGSEGGGAGCSPYPYQASRDMLDSRFRGNDTVGWKSGVCREPRSKSINRSLSYHPFSITTTY